jgi:hypothetical protein
MDLPQGDWPRMSDFLTQFKSHGWFSEEGAAHEFPNLASMRTFSLSMGVLVKLQVTHLGPKLSKNEKEQINASGIEVEREVSSPR